VVKTGDEIGVVQYGLGPIGLGVAEEVARRAGMRLAGAVDIAEDKRGRPLSDFTRARVGQLKVAGSLKEALRGKKAAVAAHCTGSRLSEVEEQILELVEAGLNVVSTCEELAYPWRHHPEEARRIHAAARRRGVTVLATGVNPGFVMDLLPIVLASAMQSVESVEVTRVVDAAKRREPLRRKVGVGLTRSDFLARGEKMGHVGLVESAAMVADALGVEVDEFEERLRPVMRRGKVAGIDQTAIGRKDGKVVVSLRLQMYAGAGKPRDRIVLNGKPPIDAIIHGGVSGDDATVAAVVNKIGIAVDSPPGLLTVKDVPPHISHA